MAEMQKKITSSPEGEQREVKGSDLFVRALENQGSRASSTSPARKPSTSSIR
ncbi:hypothetical protein HFO62_33175 [Rhizobium leguminosarum]|nr:hypothetical protein [Rhizobium leguminosarum]